MIKVGIIIVTYNGLAYLPKLCASLRDYRSAMTDTRVYFVDNASTDSTLEYLKAECSNDIILALEKNLGFAGGNNAGLKKALDDGCDYVMLLNQDIIVAEGFLDKLVERLESDQNLAAVQPRVMLYPQTDKVNTIGCLIHFLGFGYTYGHQQSLASLDLKSGHLNYVSGAACLIRSEALKKVGLFKEEFFMYHEDLDLGWRFRLAGFKQSAVLDAVVYHQYEFSRSIKKYYFMERNRLLVMLENYHWLTLLLILPAWLMMELGLIVFALKGGWFKEKMRAYGFFFSPDAWPQVFKRRKETQYLRQRKEKEVVKDFSAIIEHQEVNNPLLAVINPVFQFYWWVVRGIMFW